MKNKTPTVIELSREFHQQVTKRFHSHATVTHGASCECGGKLLYGQHTNITIPDGIVITKEMQDRVKAVVEQYYAPVTRMFIEKPFSLGGDSKVYRSLVLVHNNNGGEL